MKLEVRWVLVMVAACAPAGVGCGGGDDEPPPEWSSTDPCPPAAVAEVGLRTPGNRIYAFPEEHNHWSAIVFPANGRDATIESISYWGVPNGRIEEPDGSQMAHETAIYAIPGDEPPASPEYHQRFEVDEGDGDDRFDPRPITLTLQEPLLVRGHERVVVQVRHPADGAARSFRMGGCDAPDARASMWWSYAPEAPFPWARLPAADFSTNYVELGYRFAD